MVETSDVPKRGRGRPRKQSVLGFPEPAALPAALDPAEAEPLEAAAPAEFDFGVPYQTFGPGQAAEFQRFTELYPDRRDISCYVWRLDPPIDRRQVGISDSNIEIIPGAVDLEGLLQRHGSGEYHLKFNDSNVKPAQRAKCTVKLDDPTKPANVNPQELLVTGVKGNRNAALIARYVGQGWSVVDKKNELIAEGFRALEPPPAVSPVVESKSAGVDKALVDLLREALLARSAKEGGELDRAFQIAKQLTPPPPVMDPVLGKLLQAAVDRMLIPAAPAAAAAVDPMEHIEKMGNFFSKMGWTAPGAGGGSAGLSWTDALAALPGILQHGAALVSQLMAYRMMTTAGAPIAGPPAAPPAPYVPAFLPAMPPAAAGIPTGDDEMLNPAKLAALMEVGRMAMQSIESGEAGDDFAERLCASPQFEAIYDDLVAMGKAGIVSTLGSIPGLNAKLEPRRAELEVWLGRFLAYAEPGPGTAGGVDAEFEPEPQA